MDLDDEQDSVSGLVSENVQNNDICEANETVRHLFINPRNWLIKLNIPFVKHKYEFVRMNYNNPSKYDYDFAPEHDCQVMDIRSQAEFIERIKPRVKEEIYSTAENIKYNINLEVLNLFQDVVEVAKFDDPSIDEEPPYFKLDFIAKKLGIEIIDVIKKAGKGEITLHAQAKKSINYYEFDGFTAREYLLSHPPALLQLSIKNINEIIASGDTEECEFFGGYIFVYDAYGLVKVQGLVKSVFFNVHKPSKTPLRSGSGLGVALQDTDKEQPCSIGVSKDTVHKSANAEDAMEAHYHVGWVSGSKDNRIMIKVGQSDLFMFKNEAFKLISLLKKEESMKVVIENNKHGNTINAEEANINVEEICRNFENKYPRDYKSRSDFVRVILNDETFCELLKDIGHNDAGLLKARLDRIKYNPRKAIAKN